MAEAAGRLDFVEINIGIRIYLGNVGRPSVVIAVITTRDADKKPVPGINGPGLEHIVHMQLSVDAVHPTLRRSSVRPADRLRLGPIPWTEQKSCRQSYPRMNPAVEKTPESYMPAIGREERVFFEDQAWFVSLCLQRHPFFR